MATGIGGSNSNQVPKAGSSLPTGSARAPADANVCLFVACALAFFVASAISYSILRKPLEVSDSLIPILQVQDVPLIGMVYDQFHASGGYIRPFYWATVKVLSDVSAGHHFFAYKAFHIAQVLVLLGLFTWIARPRDRIDLAVFHVAVAVLVGLHTFNTLVRSAHPINGGLSIGIACLAVVALAADRYRWIKDLVAPALLIYVAFHAETGLLVWVCLTAGFIVGWRGVSWRGVALATAVVGTYFYLRFYYLDVGIPELTTRGGTGFGFGALDARELEARFGSSPTMLYVYNVLASFFSVLFTEPRSGTFVLIRDAVAGELRPREVVGFVSSLSATAVLCWFGWSRRHAWVRLRLSEADRIVIVSLGVIVANATFGFLYTKDEIMAIGGIFYAVAVYAALRQAVRGFCARQPGLRVGVFVVGLFALLSISWSMRAAGLVYLMQASAFQHQDDWVDVYDFLEAQNVTLDEGDRRLVDELRREALAMEVPNPYPEERWADRWFDVR